MPTSNGNTNHVVLFMSPCCDVAVPSSHPAAAMVQGSGHHSINNNITRPRFVVKNFLFLSLIAFSCFLYIFAIRLVMVSHMDNQNQYGGAYPSQNYHRRDRNREEYRSSESGFGFASFLRGGETSEDNSQNSPPKKPRKYDDDFSIEEEEPPRPERHKREKKAKTKAENGDPLKVAADVSNQISTKDQPKDFMGVDDKITEGEGKVTKQQLDAYLNHVEKKVVTDSPVAVRGDAAAAVHGDTEQSVKAVSVMQDIVVPKNSISMAPSNKSSAEEHKDGDDADLQKEDVIMSFTDSQEIEFVETDATIHEPFGIPIPQEKFQDIFHSRNLMLGLAANTDSKNIAIFCGSIRAVNKEASVVLFVNDPIPADQTKIFADYNIHTLSYDQSKLFPAFLHTYHPSSLRWIFYDRLLNLQVNNKHYQGIYFHQKFDKVIVLDIRDSTFQSDPFELIRLKHHHHHHHDNYTTATNTTATSTELVVPTPTASPTSPDYFKYKRSKLMFFGEDPSSMINMCTWNSGWVRDCFGDKILDEVGFQPIICSGVSMGTMKYMLRYVNKMSALLEGRGLEDYPTSNFPACERNGVDQGLHNVLIHTKKLKGYHILYHVDFPVVNLQSALDVSPTIIEENGKTTMSMKMADMSQTPYALVHQYDRSVDYQLSLAKQYVKWIDWNNPMSEWENSATCKSFVPLPEIDLFRGMCDLKSVRVLTAASCCDACLAMNPIKGYLPLDEINKLPDNKRYCTGFTYTGGVCYFKSCSREDVITRADVYTKYREHPELLDDYTRATLMERGATTGYISLPTQ